MTFEDLLKVVFRQPANGWVYLPTEEAWGLQSTAAVFVSDEVPPELEDEPDAGVPEIAKQAGLKQVIPVACLQDIIANATEQVGQPTPHQLFEAFSFYYENDAFMVFDGDPS